MTRRNVRKQGWVFPLFSSDSDDRLSLNLYIEYQTCENLGSIGHRSREKTVGKPYVVSARFAVS